MFLSRLSLSLFIACFTFISSAAPVQLTVLTADNFQDTVSSGVWFIEHFSPYCRHCREFAPTWQDLVDSFESSPNSGVHLAQVNCAVNGDLCNEHKVTGYPQMNLYRNGEFVETYKDSREFEKLQKYLLDHADVEPSPLVSSAEEKYISSTLPTPTAEPLHIQTSRAGSNPSGFVLPLNDENFHDTIREGPVFIKFFAPWCGHCKKLAPTWTQLSRHMQNKLTIAEVNCEDHAALCSSEGVKAFPMLYFYANGVKTEYTGGRKLDQMKDFAERASSPALIQLHDQNIDEHISANPVLYLLLHSNSYAGTVDDVSQAASVLLGSPPVFLSTSPELMERFSVGSNSQPVLLVFKDNDAMPFARYSIEGPSTTESINNWLVANRLPTSLELSQETFQQVMNAAHKPLVVIAAVTPATSARTAEKLRELGKKWRLRTAGQSVQRDVVFTWMDAGRWSSWMKSMYGIKDYDGDDAPIVIADHSKLLYWDKDTQGQPLKLTSTSLFTTVDRASRGEIRGKHSENIIERFARYMSVKVAAFEAYVVRHPMHIVFFLVGGLVLLIFALKRALADDVTELSGNGNRKSDRLD